MTSKKQASWPKTGHPAPSLFRVVSAHSFDEIGFLPHLGSAGAMADAQSHRCDTLSPLDSLNEPEVGPLAAL